MYKLVRNSCGWVFARLLILFGFVGRAKKRTFEQSGITGIAFHNPNKKLFRKIVLWLKGNGFIFLCSRQVIGVINGQEKCPEGAVWISLDDGWISNIENVIPTAIAENVPITIFVNTEAVEDGSFWWLKVRQRPNVLPVNLQSVEAIRKMPKNSRKEVLDTYRQKGIVFPREAMSVDDIKYISTVPQVTLGAHTVTHPVLPNCDDDEIEYEISESKKILEEWTGKEVKTFAYPNGAYDGREKPFLNASGYEMAATAENELISSGIDPYLVPRFEIVDDGSFAENIFHLLGIWKPIISRLKKIFLLRSNGKNRI